MQSIISKILIILTAAVLLTHCKSAAGAGNEPIATDGTMKEAATFNADSAYSYVAAQCEFGARVPNAAAHTKCGDYLVSQLSKYGTVTVQTPELTAFNGTKLNARNIICSINPDSARRVLLIAHWDSRPWADEDPDASRHNEPVLGANDGASGVGVLLELARIMSEKRPDVGVDILLTDAEDMGTDNNDASWALGTQYWVNNKHKAGYRPMFGILLDMVGAKDARFTHEAYSEYYAPQVLKLVWDAANKAGYGKYFLDKMGGGVTDDHIFINRDGIPTIDIIDCDNSNGSGFFPYWHTTGDVMEHISPETLKAVGQTVANIIYSL